jgi:hypothetical protein
VLRAWLTVGAGMVVLSGMARRAVARRTAELERQTASVRLLQEVVVAAGLGRTLFDGGQAILDLVCAYTASPLATAWGISRHRDRLVHGRI